MLKPPTKAVVTVGAATVLAFGAAGLSVARSGTDAAAQSTPPGSPTGTTPRGPVPGGGPGAGHEHRIDTLADELGVDAAKLREALDAVREQQRPTRGSKGDRRSEHRDALAKALGVDADTIDDALKAARPERPQGTTPPPRDERGPRGRGAHRGHGKHHEAMVAALAKATGKSEAHVKTALTQLAKDRDAEHKQREAGLVKALAQQLGLSESKVASAVEAARPAKPSGKHRPGYATP